MAKDQHLANGQGLRYGETGFRAMSAKDPQRRDNLPRTIRTASDGCKNVGGAMVPRRSKLTRRTKTG
jgi:hypothetical protein